jgi:hypothetical protein
MIRKTRMIIADSGWKQASGKKTVRWVGEEDDQMPLLWGAISDCVTIVSTYICSE